MVETAHVRAAPLPETRGYRFKRALLGKPLVSEQLSEERLASPIALGVLSPDCISSTAYGSEEMLTILVPAAGAVAFALLMPVTIAIIGVLFFVTLSYREVVTVYTKAGGSYVVARDNFGLKTAQVAAVALLIDYTVTVAVQSAAGTNALTSAVPSLAPYQLPITVGVVVLLVYGNLRGIREAGRIFALPTYLFIFATAGLIVVGFIRSLIGGLPRVAAAAGTYVQDRSHLGHTGNGHGLLMGVAVFMLLKAFANGGSSLTGLEAISNGVGAFRPPEGRNARRTLVIMSCTLGFLVLGVSYLAHLTHATPYLSGSPTVLSQEARVVFGSSLFGHAVYLFIQLVTLLILYTGANTSFNGFPFLASFVAGDRFLPMKLTKRGHRLVFSNGIIVLAVVSIGLLLVTRARVDSLVAVYAIGVFTGFTMAGAGMSKHHWTNRQPGWHRKIFINGFSALLSFAVVVIFAVTKFKQGAWVVVVLFPLLWLALTRLNRRYREEASVLGETLAEAAAEAQPLSRSVGLILVDRLDLATARAIQYARTLSLDDLRAVHFVIDNVRAERLQERWVRLGLKRFPLELVDCPDRRVVRASLERVDAELHGGDTEVTVILPRRHYRRIWSRILHDATGERIATTLGRMPHVAATILPLDVDAELRDRRRATQAVASAGDTVGARSGDEAEVHGPLTGPAYLPTDGDDRRSVETGAAIGDGPRDPVPAGVGPGERRGAIPTPPESGNRTSGPARQGDAGVLRSGPTSPPPVPRAGNGDTAGDRDPHGAVASADAPDARPPQSDPQGPIGPPARREPSASPAPVPDRSIRTGDDGGRPPAGDDADGDRRSAATVRTGGSVPIGEIRTRQRVRSSGRITSVTVQTWGSVPTLECVLRDDTGSVLVAFLGRRRIPGITAGSQMEVTGTVGERSGRLVVINPDYQLRAAPGA